MDLKKYLRIKGITQLKLAEDLGVDKSFIWGICNGRMFPGQDLAAAIEKYSKGNVKASVLRKPLKTRVPCPTCGRMYYPKKNGNKKKDRSKEPESTSH